MPKRGHFENEKYRQITSITLKNGAYINTEVGLIGGFMIEGRLMTNIQGTTWFRSTDSGQRQSLQNESNYRTISIRAGQPNKNVYCQFRNLVDVNTPFDIEASNIGSDWYCKFNGVVKTVSWRSGTKATSFTSDIFVIGPSSLTSYPTYYFLKFYSDLSKNNLVADFIPVIDASLNEAGLYDRVSGKFYGNSAGVGQIDYTL